MICYEIYQTRLGELMIAADETGLVHLYPAGRLDSQGMQREETPLLGQAAKAVEDYMTGGSALFALPLSPQGTPFQRKVWEALRQIPYGETRSYGQLAEMVGNPKASRAVGAANGKNTILIAIPCHRVVGADGSLTGFAAGLEMKKELLALEQASR